MLIPTNPSSIPPTHPRPPQASVGTVIFDFDGTIADSLAAGIKIGNQLAEEFGLEPITMDKLRRWQNLSSQQILKEAKIPFFRIPRLLSRFRVEMNREVPQLSPIPGIQEALLALKQNGYRLGIVSSNSENNVWAFLHARQLDHLFDFVVSSPRVLGKNKVLKRLIKEYQLHPDHVFYIGDETRDVEAAHKTGVKSIAVCWGFNSPHALRSHNPDFLLRDPQELVSLLCP
ncbi:HAD-IA family hydrolase [Alkalinema pantanalense CENA528]|uniref:HAD-IA family hydrolase n=1 Tax=Alkalinema pantanalense TaxID=1620705 RepID=UPI003D6EB945